MSKIAKSNGMMGFDTNVYSKLDSLFHDDEKEFFIKCDDIYIKNAFKKYLEDNNFEYKDSNINNQFIFVSTTLGSFKFVDEANSKVLKTFEVTPEVNRYWDDWEVHVVNRRGIYWGDGTGHVIGFFPEIYYYN